MPPPSFNAAMALETEGKTLDPITLIAGVEHLLQHPDLGFYLVAKTNDDKPVGTLMITYEWSDWRNGVFWWIQSVYVEKDYRGSGVFSALYDEVRRLAKIQNPPVCGMRLYVEQHQRPSTGTAALRNSNISCSATNPSRLADSPRRPHDPQNPPLPGSVYQ